MGDPTLSVINRMQDVLEELHVKVERHNLFEEKKNITSLPNTLTDTDGIILASTVEWHGIGGFMHEFLDACWLYGNKERISSIYMLPVVMSTTYGEREGKLELSTAWEILGGRTCSGICGYIQDAVAFELNPTYMKLIEKKAESLYRCITQKVVNLPSSNQAVKQRVSATTAIDLTPQETEQLSKYASDDNYVQTQKEDIKELASHFKTLLGNHGISSEDMLLGELQKRFVPQNDFSASYKILIKNTKSALIIEIADDKLDSHYGTIENPSVICKTDLEHLNDIIYGRMSFQRAFMSGEMQVKGDFKLLRMLDTVFVSKTSL